VLAGDVGTGKTELASTIGDAIARAEKIEITLYPLSLSTRGSGLVGEMTTLLSAAFDFVVEAAAKFKSESAKSRGAIIMLVDEADAIGQSREEAHMHHEDRAGVNTFIRGVDRIANERLPAAVIMCTNRPSVLDPAIRRRAAATLVFDRPNEEQRRAVLAGPLSGLDLADDVIGQIVAATGKGRNGRLPFSYSDLTQRLIPEIVLDAYPDDPVDPDRALELALAMVPTPTFRDGSS
jgi:AAA+ superfamily predicted ATPase